MTSVVRINDSFCFPWLLFKYIFLFSVFSDRHVCARKTSQSANLSHLDVISLLYGRNSGTTITSSRSSFCNIFYN